MLKVILELKSRNIFRGSTFPGLPYWTASQSKQDNTNWSTSIWHHHNINQGTTEPSDEMQPAERN